MEHGLDTADLAVVAACVLGWCLVSARLGRWSVTSPLALVAIGVAVGDDGLALVDIAIESSGLRSLAEITLALVLFSDASRVNVAELRRDALLPLRLLLIGLPITMAVGFGITAALFSGIDLWVAALIAAAVAPTDAALGAPIMEDRRVPERVRRVLNVESGLNDGLVTPLVSFFIAGAAATLDVSDASALGAAREIGVGVLVGAVVGGGGGVLVRLAVRHDWCEGAMRRIAVLALAFVAYAGAIEVGGNGFVAVFVGGTAFGSIAAHELGLVRFTSGLGELLSLLVWLLFGAVIVVPAIDAASWETLAFAASALTVVRMVPVAVALTGVGLDRATVALVGWFGPRGLASVVFGLLALDALGSTEGSAPLSAISITVLMSVVAHGMSTGPIARLYATRAAAHLDEQSPELSPVEPLAVRGLGGVAAHPAHRVPISRQQLTSRLDRPVERDVRPRSARPSTRSSPAEDGDGPAIVDLS